MTKLAEKLESLQRQVTEMGDAVESMVAWAAAAFADHHPHSIQRVTAIEPKIDRFQIEIDSEAIRLMTIYSPIARDLRFLLMVARINSELERIGDQALINCEYIAQLPSAPRPKPLADLSRMYQVARGMVHDALEAFKHNIDLAQQVVNTDDEVDALFAQTFRDLLIEGSATRDRDRVHDDDFSRPIGRADRRSRHQHLRRGDLRSQRRGHPASEGRGR